MLFGNGTKQGERVRKLWVQGDGDATKTTTVKAPYTAMDRCAHDYSSRKNNTFLNSTETSTLSIGTCCSGYHLRDKKGKDGGDLHGDGCVDDV